MCTSLSYFLTPQPIDLRHVFKQKIMLMLIKKMEHTNYCIMSKKTIIALLSLAYLGLSNVYCQVGIGNQDPKATLDVSGNPTDANVPDGIIVPRLTGDQLTAKDALYTNTPPNDRTGTMVYVTEAASSPSVKTANVLVPGYYFFDGNLWQRVTTGDGTTIYKDNGALSGNRIVDMPNSTLSFTPSGTKVVNQFSIDGATFSVDALNERVGVGTLNPTQALDVDGNMRLRGQIIDNNNNAGTNGQILSTNSSGNVEWVSSAATKSFIVGNFGTGGSGSGTTMLNLNTWYYTNAFITLPPGRWLLSYGSSASAGAGGFDATVGADGMLWIVTSISNSNTSYTPTSDILGSTGTQGAGSISRGQSVCMVTGNHIIENNSGAPKTYYIWSRTINYGVELVERIATIFSTTNLERWLYAIPQTP